MMKIVALLLNIFNLLVLAASVVSLLPTAMMFDSPGSEKKKSYWFLMCVFLLFPFIALTSLAMGWLRWRQGDYQSALKAGGVTPAYGAVAAVCLFSIYGK